MKYEKGVKQYEIKIGPSGSGDWHDITGLSYEMSETINEFVKEKYPLGTQELQRIKAMLEAYIQDGDDYLFGLTIAEQNEIEGRLIIVQFDSQQFVKEVNKSPKELVWENVMSTGLAAKNETKFDRLIRANMDRVQFVRDGVGLRDFLFLSQDEIDNGEGGFQYDAYAVLDLDVEPTEQYEIQGDKHHRKRIADETKILSQLKEFFDKTNRTLFVGVGFQENLELDPLLQLRRITGNTSGSESIAYLEAKARVFPVWYKKVATMPENVNFVSKKAERFIKEFLDQEELDVLKDELMKMDRQDLVKIIEKI